MRLNVLGYSENGSGYDGCPKRIANQLEQFYSAKQRWRRHFLLGRELILSVESNAWRRVLIGFLRLSVFKSNAINDELLANSGARQIEVT
jgi:hypothetical protein